MAADLLSLSKFNYGDMYRFNPIVNALLPLVGWEPESGYTLTRSVTESESGLRFQYTHPLLTLQNVASVAPVNDIASVDQFEPGADYKKGDVVKTTSGYLYRAVADNSDDVLTDPEHWEETSMLSEWLERKKRGCVMKVVSRFVTDKMNKSTYKTLLESRTLFDGTGRITDTDDLRDNMVGMEINVVRSKGVTLTINKIGLQFTAAGTYKLYLFHSGKSDPVRTIELVKRSAGSMEWFTLDDLALSYEGTDRDSGGSWYLAYKQSELPEGAKSVRKRKDWSKAPCYDCTKSDFEAWAAWSKYMEVHPFYVNEESLPEDGTLWDVNDNFYRYDTNWGLNLDVTVSCDATEFIIKEKNQFSDVISKQMAVDLLREFLYNPAARINRNAVNASKPEIIYDLDGSDSDFGNSGLVKQLEEAYKALEVSTEGMDRVCLPCHNGGIKYRSV